MRVRASIVVTASFALALAAGAAFAQDQPAAAAPAAADTAKKPAAKSAAKSGTAAHATVDAAVKAIDAQIAKNAADKKDPAWKTKLKMPTLVKFDPAKTSPDKIAAAITESGYPASLESPGANTGNVEEERLHAAREVGVTHRSSPPEIGPPGVMSSSQMRRCVRT